MPKRLWHWREQPINGPTAFAPWESRYRALSRSIHLRALDSFYPVSLAGGEDHFFPRLYVLESTLWTLNDVFAYTPTSTGVTFANDQQALSYLIASTGMQNRSGVCVRASGTTAGSENMYVAWFGGASTLTLGKYVAGAFTSLGTSAKTFGSGVGWFLRLEAAGTTIRCRAWRYDATEPASWDISVTDASLSAGAPGLAGAVPDNAAVGVVAEPRFFSSDDGAATLLAPMPRTRADVMALSSGRDQPVHLVELGVLGQTSAAAANASKVCLSTAPFVSQAVDDIPDTAYDDIILEMPNFKTLATELFRGRSTQSFGELVVASEGGSRDDWLTWSFDGRAADIWVGAVGWRRWDFIKLGSNVVSEVYAPSKDRLSFRLRDKSSKLARKFQPNVMAGTTANAGRPMPWARGTIFNIEPALEDAAALRYRFDDGGIDAADITLVEVRDSGVAVSATEGTGANSGTFTLSSAPTGRITCDVDMTPGTVRHASLFSSALEQGGVFSATDLYIGNGIGNAVNWGDNLESGIYQTQETTTGRVLDEIATSCSAFWWFDRLGYLRVMQFAAPTAFPFHEIEQDDVVNDTLKLDRLMLPSDPEFLYAMRNYTQQADGLAGAVSATDRALYASVGALGTFTPSYSGLDQPANHLLKQTPEARLTLYANQADAVTEGERLDAIRRKLGAIFSFEVQAYVPTFGLGETINLTYDRYGFDAGKAGLIVGLDEDYGRGRVRITFFTTLDGQFPVTSAAYPVVDESYFY